MIKFENHLNGRYYYLYLHKDLFDDLVLTVVRGGKFNRIVRNHYFRCKKRALQEIERISRIREKRGYRLVQ